MVSCALRLAVPHIYIVCRHRGIDTSAPAEVYALSLNKAHSVAEGVGVELCSQVVSTW